jgi:hypothetical protein
MIIDKETLDDAFETRKNLQTKLHELDREIREAAQPLILAVLALYNDKNFWPGRTAGDITLKIHELYTQRFTEEDIARALDGLNHEGTVIRTNIGERMGYNLNLCEKPATYPDDKTPLRQII